MDLSSLVTVIIPSCHECSDSLSHHAARQQIRINGYVLHPAVVLQSSLMGHICIIVTSFVFIYGWYYGWQLCSLQFQTLNHIQHLIKTDFHVGNQNTTIQYERNCALMDLCRRIWMTKRGCWDFLINQWQRLKKNKMHSKVTSYAEIFYVILLFNFFLGNVKTHLCEFFVCFVLVLLVCFSVLSLIADLKKEINHHHIYNAKKHSTFCVWNTSWTAEDLKTSVKINGGLRQSISSMVAEQLMNLT